MIFYPTICIDNFFESTFIDKQIYATTIPTQWVVEFENGNSLTMYLETQTKRVRESDFEYQYVNHYSSLSYSHHGKWIVTGFYDQEIKDDKSNRWLGSDFSYKLNTETMVSIFYGSQKGGLVCANGSCVYQPDFEDGFKVIYRMSF